MKTLEQKAKEEAVRIKKSLVGKPIIDKLIYLRHLQHDLYIYIRKLRNYRD